MVRRLSRLAINTALDALFPRFCAGCGTEGSAWCTSCEERGLPAIQKAGCPFCNAGDTWRTCESCRTEAALDGVVTLFPYGDPAIRQLLTTWKYHGDSAYGNAAMGLVRAWLGKYGTQIPAVDVVTFVPLHPRRARARGFDQAEVIAQTVARVVGVPKEGLLVRTHATSERAHISHVLRALGDLDGMFAVEEGIEVPARVLLCDDVFTSGATMDAAAQALKEAGAKEVWGLAVAKG